MIKRRNFVLIILICVACLLSTTAIISFAVAYKQNREQLTTEIGTVKVVSVVNPTESTKLEYKTTETTNVNVSINLDCNVNAVVRVKISPRFYDENDRQVVIPNSLIYNVNDHQGRWISDTNNMCFYFANSVKDIEVLDFLKSISFNTHEYFNYKFDLVIEADILQTVGIDYSNHPWKENAPQEWLNIVKEI